MKFVFMRDITISTLMGHTIEFKKGEPTYVVPDARKEVIQRGGVPEDEVDVAEILNPQAKQQPGEPQDPDERKKAVFAAFEKMKLADVRGSFTAAGVPHAKALAEALGWQLDAKERDALWVEFTTPAGQ